MSSLRDFWMLSNPNPRTGVLVLTHISTASFVLVLSETVLVLVLESLDRSSTSTVLRTEYEYEDEKHDDFEELINKMWVMTRTGVRGYKMPPRCGFEMIESILRSSVSPYQASNHANQPNGWLRLFMGDPSIKAILPI